MLQPVPQSLLLMYWNADFGGSEDVGKGAEGVASTS